MLTQPFVQTLDLCCSLPLSDTMARKIVGLRRQQKRGCTRCKPVMIQLDSCQKPNECMLHPLHNMHVIKSEHKGNDNYDYYCAIAIDYTPAC